MEHDKITRIYELLDVSDAIRTNYCVSEVYPGYPYEKGALKQEQQDDTLTRRDVVCLEELTEPCTPSNINVTVTGTEETFVLPPIRPVYPAFGPKNHEGLAKSLESRLGKTGLTIIFGASSSRAARVLLDS